MKNIVVTGGAGFIGSNLCAELIRQGHRVFCVDNFFSGSRDHIASLISETRFIVIEHDIVEPLYLNDPIDEIYQLACPGSPVQYQYNAIHTIKANTLGLINMLGLAKQHNAKILQASTSEVYGDPQIHPQTEVYRGNVNSFGPRACYDEGKRCGEALCFEYHRSHGVQVKVVRIFNTYGPQMSPQDGRVVSNFIVQALRGDAITIYGDGSQTRSFCFVTDLIQGFLAMTATGADITGPINLGNPIEYTVIELAKKIITLTGSTSTIVFQPLPIDDPTRRQPDITLAKNILHWQPTVDLDTGLTQAIAYFKQHI